MRIWIWRRPGPPHGKPKGAYNREVVRDQVPALIERIFEAVRAGERERLKYGSPAGGYRTPEEFFMAELFERETLRQGWGVPGLDITRDRDHSYIAEYVFASWKYWGADGPLEVARRQSGERLMSGLNPFFRVASGRYTILERMNRMNRKDVVFIPKTMRAGHHDRGFTVVAIAGDYRFEERVQELPGSWLKDFGHQRPVKWARSYEYSDRTLPASHFQIYRAAICRVAPGHELYSDFSTFVERVYLRDVRRSDRN